MATSARGAHELAHLLHQPRQDLEAMITAVERLTPANMALFHAREDEYHQQLKFYVHTPQGVKDAWQRLMSSVEVLTQRLEAAGRGAAGGDELVRSAGRPQCAQAWQTAS
jgi:hypothetical protein